MIGRIMNKIIRNDIVDNTMKNKPTSTLLMEIYLNLVLIAFASYFAANIIILSPICASFNEIFGIIFTLKKNLEK